MTLSGIQSAKNNFLKTRQQCLFPDVRTQLLKIIHRHYEQFHGGTIISLSQYTEESLHLLADERLTY